MHREHQKAIATEKSLRSKLEGTRSILTNVIPTNLIPSVTIYNYLFMKRVSDVIQGRHQHKLRELAKQQEKPLLNISNTLKVLEQDITPPDYVLQVLSMGPKHPVLDEFRPKQLLADVDVVLERLAQNCASDTINQVNITTVQYINEYKN